MAAALEPRRSVPIVAAERVVPLAASFARNLTCGTNPKVRWSIRTTRVPHSGVKDSLIIDADIDGVKRRWTRFRLMWVGEHGAGPLLGTERAPTRDATTS